MATVAYAGAVLSLLALLAPFPAAASAELAKAQRCMNCHGMDRKIVGPSFRDISRRYANAKGITPYLTEKVIQGGANAWGPVPMAANPQVSPEDARKLVEWVLTLR